MFVYVNYYSSKIGSTIKSQREISWIFRPWQPHLNPNANYCGLFCSKRTFAIYKFFQIR